MVKRNMTKKDKKEDVDRISKMMDEDAPETPVEEEPKAEPTEEPEKPKEEPKEEESLDDMSKDLGKEKKPKKEEKPKEDIQQIQVRMTRAISLGFNIAIGFWLFTLILGLIIGIVLVAFFRVPMPF